MSRETANDVDLRSRHFLTRVGLPYRAEYVLAILDSLRWGAKRCE
jgi:hypothetical protein